jgi:putative DNA primase/helicase
MTNNPYLGDSADSSRHNPHLQAALAFASNGWPVFPCRGKVPRAGSHGYLDATADKNQIRDWWTDQPDANVAISTGPAGLVVIDIDPRNGGAASLSALTKDPTVRAAFGAAPQVITGGGGAHYYFLAPRCKFGAPPKGRLGPGIDVQGAGRYVIAPPSIHPETRRRYEWFAPSVDYPLASLPLSIVELLACDESPNHRDDVPGIFREGERNAQLASRAGTIRRGGSSEDAILAFLLTENLTRCAPPLPEDEVRVIARSIASYPARRGGEPLLSSTANLPRVRTDHRNLAQQATDAVAVLRGVNDIEQRLFLRANVLVRIVLERD